MTPGSNLISFFEGSKGDYRGRTLLDMLAWPDNELEISHDYIQTLFPLPEVSLVNWNSSIIDRGVFEAFRSRPELRENLRKALKRMLSFYGFKLLEQEEKKIIVLGDNFGLAAQNWVRRFDHNHLRITRIIRSLRVLGLEEEALAFFQALKSVQEASTISPTSLIYWSRAAFRPLNIAPDEDSEDEDDVRGPTFLREFEMKRREQAKVKKGNAGSTAKQTVDPSSDIQ